MSNEPEAVVTAATVEFDFTHTNHDPSPSWLLDDIHELMKQRSGEGTTVLPQDKRLDKVNKQIMKHRRLPEKLDMYKNLQKEKAPPPPSTEVYTDRLKKSKIVGGISTESEVKVHSFLQLLSDKRKRKKDRYNDYMHKSQGCPSPTPFLTTRYSSTSRPMLETLSKRNTDIKSRPYTAPDIMSSQPLARRAGTVSPLSSSIKSTRGHQGFFPPSSSSESLVIDSPESVANCIAMFAKIAKYADHLRIILLHTKLHLLSHRVAGRKITQWLRVTRDERRRIFKEKMPIVLTTYLRRFQKKRAVLIISTFIRECSAVQSAAIVKKFLICVRRVQSFVRDWLAVRAARMIAVHKLWRRTEVQYRRAFADHEKETLLRLQKERTNRMSSSGNASVYDKWGLTHQQVMALFNHMDEVQAKRTATLQRLDSAKDGSVLDTAQMQETEFIDMVEEPLRDEIIDRHIRAKRALFLQRVEVSMKSKNAPATEKDGISRPSKSVVSMSVAQRFLKASDRTAQKKLLEQQLAPSGAPLDDRKVPPRFSGRSYKALRHLQFLCYTDASLGRSWKAIIEEVVREDILKKKKIMQQKNKEALNERLKEDKVKRCRTHNIGVSVTVKHVGGTTASSAIDTAGV